MKPEGPHGEHGRDPNSLEYMEKQIDAERKTGLLLSEQIEEGIESGEEIITFAEFAELLKKKKPEQIILYSVKTGLLRHLLTTKEENETICTYQGDSYILYIYIEHDKKTDSSYIVQTKKLPKETRMPAPNKKEAVTPKQRPHIHEEGSYRGYTDPEVEAVQDRIKALEKMEKEIAADEKKLVGLPLDENIKKDDPIKLFEDAISNDAKIKPGDIAFYSIATGILKYSRSKDFLPKGISYYYTNPNNKGIELDILVNLENMSARVFSIKNKSKETQKQNKSQEEYSAEVEETRTGIENLSSAIKARLQKKNPVKPNTIK